tara:strand:- start:3923 stop:4498 length:576 start_codon:yes stop_codon:yes gene_type:complete
MSDPLDNLIAEIEGDSESSLDLPENDGISSIAKIAEQILAKQQEVENLTENLKKVKAKLLKLTDEELPSAMQELNVSSFSLGDGSQVTLKATYGARISEDNRDDAFEWLRVRNEADIIKNTVTVRFNREQDNEAQALVDDLVQRQMSPEQRSEVHPQTLRSWAKTRIEEGKELDMTLFGVWVGQRAEIKRT